MIVLDVIICTSGEGIVIVSQRMITRLRMFNFQEGSDAKS